MMVPVKEGDDEFLQAANSNHVCGSYAAIFNAKSLLASIIYTYAELP